MAWILVIVAGVFEVVWAYYMKQSDGFTKSGPTTITIVAMVASFWESPQLIGAPLWGDGVKLWIERSPLFHLDEIAASLRIERYDLIAERAMGHLYDPQASQASG